MEIVSDKNKKYRENPNPNARIGFVVFYPFQFNVFKNVYEHLKEEAEFIVDGGRFFPTPPPPEIIENCIRLLTQQGVYFRILNYEDYRRQKYLADFFSNYKVLVGLWRSGCLVIPQTDKARKVHMNYGAGKELTMFWSRHRDWDLYLCLGPRVYEIIKLFTWAEIVGYPKFDDWFNDFVDENAVAEIKKKLDPLKKTVLYLPTHGDLSSIDELAGELGKNAPYYNIVVKPHYYAPLEEPSRIKKLQCAGILLFQDESDTQPFFKVADVVVSDNSSAIFDAILADKPVVVTDFLSEEYLNESHKKLKSFRFRLPEGALTYSGSIEQRIKNDGSVVALKKAAEFKNAVERALADGQEFQEARKKLREEIFAYSDGKCGERAAAAIKKLISLKRLPEKPILYHVFEAEYQTFREYSNALNKTGPSGRGIMDYYSQQAIFRIKALPLLRRILTVIRLFFGS
ncbi:MAG: CDP-glycerol glycerophosphotransferase family protein [Candidatus Azambacteria bacterium]|nr:CDP-glycerol glycerophosphotransferase family protein [Candidatus Azambacteria bacterium]